MNGLSRLWLRSCAACGLLTLAIRQPVRGDEFAAVAERACQRVVKVYGGAIGREKGYGSGVVISADGQVVTTLGTLLEGRALRVVVADGTSFPARVEARDGHRQLALLKIEAEGLPHFTLQDSAHLRPGDWVMAAANPFKVADGPEPVSISVGMFAGRTNLEAQRGVQEFPYDGPVLLTDVIVTTPGSAGGALVDLEGRLVGVIGKPVISQRTNTWLNYALPVEEVAAFVRRGDDGSFELENQRRIETASPKPAADLGIRLFDIGDGELPAYVERVRPGSPAAVGGVRANDLLLSIAGTAVETCGAYAPVLERLRPGETVEVLLKRGEALLRLEVVVGEQPP